ncbi:fatty acid desaturase family protein [Nocardia sp. 004]|uniref:fatty acid desaturase family protein n=1 Tax=Nocardia sp. 004 TaxID=3385978 RepID=UPI0039A248CE
MAISDVGAYAHLAPKDIEEFGQRLDLLRKEIESDLGEKDARYIHRTIAFQRSCEALARIVLATSSGKRAGWWAGMSLLTLSKIVENMEIGHNVMHGQWDWMNDPEIHSTTWEWDHSMPAEHWREAHNFRHHVYANVIGMDPDEGYGLLRITRDRTWRPYHMGNVLYLMPISVLYEFGMCIYHLEIPKVLAGRSDKRKFKIRMREVGRKASKQLLKDYLIFPILSGRSWRATMTADLTASSIRNIWEQMVTFCGHFPDGAEKFTRRELEDETKGEWYLRQFFGSTNFRAGPVLRFLSGTLSHQIEHHLFPDLPSNRMEEISHRVRELAEEYDLSYTSGSFFYQYLLTLRTIIKLSFPDRFLVATSDDAPETSSERRETESLAQSAGQRFDEEIAAQPKVSAAAW